MFVAHQKSGLCLMPVKGKGHGLFCKEDIAADEIVESCSTIVFDSLDARLINQTNLFNYYFSLNYLTQDEADALGIDDRNKAGCIALGMLSMANHGDTPNAAVVKDVIEGKVIMSLKAKTDIPAHTEITISYGKIWFTPV